MAGETVMSEARKYGVKVLAVDSEHSAIFQCLDGKPRESIRKLWLTASGGPFRNRLEWPKEMGDAVRVVPHQFPVSWEQRVPITRLDQNPPHPQHAPGSLPRLGDVAIGANHATVHLDQQGPHLPHSIQQQWARNELPIDGLNGRASQRHRRHRHETPDAFHDLIAERLHSSQAIGARKLEQIALSLEPAGK